MKTKLILTLVIGLFLVGFVIAGVLSNLDKNVELTKPQKDFFESKNITQWNSTQSLQGDKAQRCLISSSDFNLPCSSWINVSGMSDNEIDALFDDWELERIEQIADVGIERNNKPGKVETGSGVSVIVQK